MLSSALPTKTLAEAIGDIGAKLSVESNGREPAYTMILGAGFSYGVVPLTSELLCERIGPFYYYDGGNSACDDPRYGRMKSKDFWREFNSAGSRIQLSHGIPRDISAAYQELFTFTGANKLFAERGARSGEQFMRAFLQDAMNPGDTGRNRLNDAHRYLARLLHLQERKPWPYRPFCRTIFTTNFDRLLPNSLDEATVPHCITDRPELGIQGLDFFLKEKQARVHLVYTHGSILCHNPANTVAEIADLNSRNGFALWQYLEAHDVLVLGYGGWNDGLMAALGMCDPAKHRVYWFNRFSEEDAEEKLDLSVIDLINTSRGQVVYVPLDARGADGFMADLYLHLQDMCLGTKQK